MLNRAVIAGASMGSYLICYLPEHCDMGMFEDLTDLLTFVRFSGGGQLNPKASTHALFWAMDSASLASLTSLKAAEFAAQLVCRCWAIVAAFHTIIEPTRKECNKTNTLPEL
eukprot:4919140-Amphidinium_carterae.1